MDGSYKCCLHRIKMSVLASFWITFFFLFTMLDDSSENMCGVLSDHRCKCQDFNVECTDRGYTRIPQIETVYKARIQRLALQGNMIRSIYPSDVVGFTKLKILDVRRQRHGYCVTSWIPYIPSFEIWGACETVKVGYSIINM